MFIRTRYNNNTEWDTYWNTFYQLYKTDIDSVHTSLWKQEGLYGSSCKQYVIAQYYYAFIYALVIFLEIHRDFPNNDWDYYKTKYDIENITKCLACVNIDFNDILDIFGISFNDSELRYGIEYIGIEDTYEIEPDSIPTITTIGDISTVNMEDILNQNIFNLLI